MSARSVQPPRIARALLNLALPRADRAGALAELDDKYAEVIEAGLSSPRWWYWRQALGAMRPEMLFAGADRGAGTGGVGADIRFGIRMLAKTPLTTAVIVITLAVGLGFNGAVFSMTNTIVFMSLPVEDAGRLRFVDAVNQATGAWGLGLTYPDYLEIAATSRTFETSAAWYRTNATVRREGDLPERVVASYVTPSLFDVLRFQPPLGRRLTAEDAAPGAEPVVLIGHSAWQNRHGADPEIVGRAIRVQGTDRTIVGVLPEALEDTPFAPELWVPIADTAELAANHERRVYNVVGRMAGELPDEQVAAEIGEISARLTDRYPETHENISGRVQTYREMYSGQGNQLIMFVMMGAVGFLLLIACANVANLLISRVLHRGREIAVRSAMGASRWRLVRQLLVESLLMSLLAAVGGAVMAWWGSKLLQAGIERTGAPPWFVFSVGAEVYALVVVLAFATGILFGFAPALHAVRASAGDVLKESGRGNTGSVRTRRVTAGLVVVQVMLAVILLAGAGVMTRSAVNVQRVDWGLDTDLLTVRLTLDADRYPDSENRLDFHRELEQRVLAIPGVAAMALTSSFPSRGGFNGPAELEDRLVAEGNRAEQLSQVIVGANYFRLAGVEPRAGRLFNDTDGGDGTFPVVIEQRFAERFWPGEDPVGKRFRWVNEVDPQWMTVIGVAPRIMHLLPMSFLPDFPVFYTPYPSEPLRGMGIMVRASTDTETLATALREAVRAIDPELPLYSIDPLPRLLEENTYSWQVVAYMFTVLGAIALVLSCMGIYAVMAFAIGRREQEIGVRMALGARASEVVRLVMRVALVQTGLGLVLGLVGATLTTRLLTMFMYQVSPTDPLTFVSAVGLLLLSAVVAGWAPARRASRVDPMRALQPD